MTIDRVNFTHANLVGFKGGYPTSFHSCNFTYANLSNTHIYEDCPFYRCDLSNANLLEAEDLTDIIWGCNIFCNTIMPDGSINNDGCHLRRNRDYLIQAYSDGERNFVCLDLRYMDLSNTVLPGVNLQGANLEGAISVAANLSGANFYNANLSGCNFNKANLSYANLSNAKMG